MARLVLLSLLCFVTKAHEVPAQARPAAVKETTTDLVLSETVYTCVEQMPDLPEGGGIVGVATHLAKIVHHPLFCGQPPLKTQSVVEFVVTETGAVGNARIIRSIDSRVDKEIIQAVYSLPRFMPGRQGGVPVKVKYTIPMNFHW